VAAATTLASGTAWYPLRNNDNDNDNTMRLQIFRNFLASNSESQ
jgi:hypothetical protein